MGCYNCGSSDGSDTKLCPRCAENRARHRANPNSYMEQRRTYTSESKFPQYFIGGVAAICIGIFVVYNIQKDMQFKSLPIHERFYQKCMKKTEQEAERAEKDIRRIQKSGFPINYNWGNAPVEFRNIAMSYDDPATGIREATLITGRNFCQQQRNECEVNPVACKCPLLKARYNY